MNQQHDNTNRIVLFPNDKGDNPKRPDFKGRVNIDGTERFCSVWIQRNPDESVKLLSGNVEPPEESQQNAGNGAQQSSRGLL